MQVSTAEFKEIRMEVEWLDHLKHGFYLYKGDEFNVSVVAQGPFDWLRFEEIKDSVEMIGAKMGIETDFSVKIDTPTPAQKKNLFPSKAEEVRQAIKRPAR